MGLAARIVGQFEDLSDNLAGAVPEMIRGAGFDQVEEVARYMTIVGSLSLYRARKPVSG